MHFNKLSVLFIVLIRVASHEKANALGPAFVYCVNLNIRLEVYKYISVVLSVGFVSVTIELLLS